MNALEFNKALADLGMTTLEAAKWLGIGKSSTHRYSTGSPISGPVARALRLACGVRGARSRLFHGVDEAFVSWNDLYPLLEITFRRLTKSPPQGGEG